tara:strand:+ start:137 stop:298 length:162 start_codon:yes stop_codon:yes gene_type:complete
MKNIRADSKVAVLGRRNAQLLVSVFEEFLQWKAAYPQNFVEEKDAIYRYIYTL